jgi:hypothetical protein
MKVFTINFVKKSGLLPTIKGQTASLVELERGVLALVTFPLLLTFWPSILLSSVQNHSNFKQITVLLSNELPVNSASDESGVSQILLIRFDHVCPVHAHDSITASLQVSRLF